MHLKPQINMGKTIFWCKLHSIVLNTFPPVTQSLAASDCESYSPPRSGEFKAVLLQRIVRCLLLLQNWVTKRAIMATEAEVKAAIAEYFAATAERFAASIIGAILRCSKICIAFHFLSDESFSVVNSYNFSVLISAIFSCEVELIIYT
ncbi:hypothetical protein QWZ13_18015 [Reinekea marina]|uniref:hypothetical protein n=1 Tax=Reinekea marina TaxID=1310421 RepID=UPI0025B41BEE|nr:hypothetical protein [Reinekea marina]MDN3650806.1 hypothetical protein [Reinekea marina]